MLTNRLASLVEAGVLRREPYQEPGARVRHEYRLTAKGLDIYPVLTAVKAWGDRYLADPDGPLIDTVPATGPITVGDLLFMTAGFGLRMDSSPLAHEMWVQGVSPGPLGPVIPSEEFVARLAGLPLTAQPGESWLYHSGSYVLGVLVAAVEQPQPLFRALQTAPVVPPSSGSRVLRRPDDDSLPLGPVHRGDDRPQ